MMEIRKAVRKKAKLRLALAGPSGSGKTFGALTLAFGLDAGKVGLIDTEHGSGDLYAHLGDYDVIQLSPPYTVQQYREALEMFEAAGYGVVIIDSISHAWAGEGGLLDKHGKIVDSGKVRDSFGAWRMVTPDHNRFIDAMLGSSCHIIATMRSKTEYVLVESERNGRKVMEPKKVGMAPIQRDGMEYEFTVVLDLSIEHVASASKDRTGLFDGEPCRIDKGTGDRIRQWLESGEDIVVVQPDTPSPPIEEVELQAIKSADSMELLKETYVACVTRAKSDGDIDRVARLTEAKDIRKAELLSSDEFVKAMDDAESALPPGRRLFDDLKGASA